jgi:hypothetical protein
LSAGTLVFKNSKVHERMALVVGIGWWSSLEDTHITQESIGRQWRVTLKLDVNGLKSGLTLCKGDICCAALIFGLVRYSYISYYRAGSSDWRKDTVWAK